MTKEQRTNWKKNKVDQYFSDYPELADKLPCKEYTREVRNRIDSLKITKSKGLRCGLISTLVGLYHRHHSNKDITTKTKLPREKYLEGVLNYIDKRDLCDLVVYHKEKELVQEVADICYKISNDSEFIEKTFDYVVTKRGISYYTGNENSRQRAIRACISLVNNKAFDNRSKAFYAAGKQNFAANMKMNPTPAELEAKKILVNCFPSRVKTQEVLYGYIVDFFYEEKSIVIEIDGPIHQMQVAQDAKRDKILSKLGYKVYRFSNDIVMNHRDDFISRVSAILGEEVIS